VALALAARTARASRRGAPYRRAEARRIAALLIATAIAETRGVWPALGTTAGSPFHRKSLSLGVRFVRAQFCEIVTAAEAGTDISLTRRGRQVARIEVWGLEKRCALLFTGCHILHEGALCSEEQAGF